MRIYEIIMEARAESLATKYKDKILGRAKGDRHSGVSDESSILSFVQNLEAKFKRYVEWVLLRWLGGNFLIEDMPRVEAAIAEFDAKKRGLERKDINQYKTLSDLEDTVGLLDHIKSARQQKQEIKHAGLRKIVDNDRILLVQVMTEEAAVLIGRGTSWCTAYTDRENHFNDYNDVGPVYVLIDKATNEKFQIHYESAQVMDSYNDDYDYQKLLKIAPQLRQLESGYSDKLVEHLVVYGKSLSDYTKVFHNGERWLEAEPYIMKDLEEAFYYARDVIKGPWPEAEPYIMKEPQWAAYYASACLGKKRWPEAEPYIMQDPEYAWLYVKRVIRKPWPEAEPYIMRSPFYARVYAENILERRWPEAETYIKREAGQWSLYTKYFGIKE